MCSGPGLDPGAGMIAVRYLKHTKSVRYSLSFPAIKGTSDRSY